jgi:hypothetical protein
MAMQSSRVVSLQKSVFFMIHDVEGVACLHSVLLYCLACLHVQLESNVA